MTTTHRPLSLRRLLAASFALFTGSFILDSAFRWSNPLEGIVSGVIHVLFTGIVWLFFGLVPGLIIYGLYRWRRWQRGRTVAIVFPGIVALILAVVGLIVSPTTPAARLKRSTGAELPSSARDLRAHFTGGGFADYWDTYYFRCSSADTDTLIRALSLTQAGSFDQLQPSTRPSLSWPDPSTWAGGTLYRGGKGDGLWFYTLRTDATREQVYLIVMCI